MLCTLAKTLTSPMLDFETCYVVSKVPEGPFLKLLWSVYNVICKFVSYQLFEIEIYVISFCLLINLFHLTVLCQKPMRSSPVYIIMGTVALMDIISPMNMVFVEFVKFYKTVDYCYSKQTDYNLTFIRIIFDCIRLFGRRCSTWLSLSITIIRTLVIRNPLNPKFEILSKPRIAIFVFSGTTLFWGLAAVVDFLSFEMLIFGATFKCTTKILLGHALSWHWADYFPLYHWVDMSALFRNDGEIIYSCYKVLKAVLSKILPCFLFFVATFFLIKEIRKVEAKRKEMMSKTATSKNTSNLVLALTLTFFIAEFPLGICFALKPLFTSIDESKMFLESLETLFSFLLTPTTATHMIICVLMSAEYRENVLLVLRCGYIPRVKENTMQHLPM